MARTLFYSFVILEVVGFTIWIFYTGLCYICRSYFHGYAVSVMQMCCYVVYQLVCFCTFVSSLLLRVVLVFPQEQSDVHALICIFSQVRGFYNFYVSFLIIQK